jgi:hypothetical protein
MPITAPCDTDALALQQQAVKRIDEVIAYYRKTGDFKSRVNELHQAEEELLQSNTLLEERGGEAEVAFNLIRLGAIQRMQSQWQAASTLYQGRAGAFQQKHTVLNLG